MDKTDKIDYILTRNEAEALLLENQLIKAHKPRYNIDLKDDKTYVRIKVTTNSEWPGISITRKVARDAARYFGPYSSARSTRNTLKRHRQDIPHTQMHGYLLRQQEPAMYLPLHRTVHGAVRIQDDP